MIFLNSLKHCNLSSKKVEFQIKGFVYFNRILGSIGFKKWDSQLIIVCKSGWIKTCFFC